MAIVAEWNFHIVGMEFDGVAFAAIDLVLDVAPAFDFPAVVDAAACGAVCGDTRDDDSYGELREPCGSCRL